MNNIARQLTVSTPGRICLFGEHQDYLHLPVIAAAISLRISVAGHGTNDSQIRIDLPDIHSQQLFSLNGYLPYVSERDYFRSAVNVLRRSGFTFASGIDCEVRGNIPIKAGTSSSSALIVTWVNFLARMSDQRKRLSARETARLAHLAEVVEFREPGGMMDQYTTAVGGALFIEFHPKLKITRLSPALKAFVLGDSGESKNTRAVLSRAKARVQNILSLPILRKTRFDLHHASIDDAEKIGSQLSKRQKTLLLGTLRNREITYEARNLLRARRLNHKKIGDLLNEHQTILRDVLEISTPRIDRMLDAALNAGAYGGKINGSGGGGCMFAYAPKNPDKVSEAIRRAGGTPYIISVDSGTRTEELI
jgi:galactokinase